MILSPAHQTADHRFFSDGSFLVPYLTPATISMNHTCKTLDGACHARDVDGVSPTSNNAYAPSVDREFCPSVSWFQLVHLRSRFFSRSMDTTSPIKFFTYE